MYLRTCFKERWRVWSRMERSEAPPAAAEVARADRSECPGKTCASRPDTPASLPHQMLEEYIREAGFASDPKGWLFRTAASKNGTAFTETAMCQQDVHAMIRRRAANGGIKTKIGCHTFRATGITAYLKNGGRLEIRAADGEGLEHTAAT
jgi:hypothetical protein